MDEDEAGSPSSDQEISIREAEKEFNIHYDGDRSPYSDTEFFPLAKSTSTVKKRQYRTPDDLTSYGSVSSSNRDKYRDRDRHKRKHQQSRSPHPSSSAHSHSSSNKGREIRRNVSSGRSSPMMTHEGQWRREPSWDRDSSYPSERDERYKHRSRHQRGVEQGRVEAREASRQYQRGRDNRGHDSRDRVRSRSPLQREVRREGRRDYDHYHLPTGGGGGEERREKRGRAHQERWRREHSPLQGSHHPMVSEEEEEGEEVDSGSETGREKGGGQLSLHTHNVERLIHELLSGSSDSSNDDHKQRKTAQKTKSVPRLVFSTSPSSSSFSSRNSERNPSRSRSRSNSGSHSRSRSPRSGSRSRSDSHSSSASHSRSQSLESNSEALPLGHVMRSKFDSDDDDLSVVGEASTPLSHLFLEAPSESNSQSEAEEHKPEEEGNKEEEAAENRRLSALLSSELDEKDKDIDSDGGNDGAALPCYLPALMGCRNVECFEWLNRIEEGTYGVVHRAKDKKTGEVVALKQLKMEKEKEGFPITSLREINMLLKAKHPNVVHIKEIVVGSKMDKIYIVMEYVEHDLKALMETMTKPFIPGEVKTLMIQLLRAVHHLHDNWILHRDLKASNLLLSHKGILKVGDFGLAREYGSPLKNYTPIVVTLWYRAPELLLGAKEYSTAVDMWSVGCIFAEFMRKEPLFKGRSEIDQINQIFQELGTPNERIWPGYNKLPTTEKVTFTNYPYNNLRKKFPLNILSENGFNLLNRFLTYDPKKRISALEALDHKYFKESPLPVLPSMFPTWPAKSEMTKKKPREKSPKPPEGGVNTFMAMDDNVGTGFVLNTFQ